MRIARCCCAIPTKTDSSFDRISEAEKSTRIRTRLHGAGRISSAQQYLCRTTVSRPLHLQTLFPSTSRIPRIDELCHQPDHTNRRSACEAKAALKRQLSVRGRLGVCLGES